MVTFNLVVVGILLVFYLYLLARSQCVKRNGCFLVGAAGLGLAILSGFFTPWLPQTWAGVFVGLLSTIGSLVAFLGAFCACYCGKLPVEIPGEQPPAEAESE